jgi:hypothetical protein
LQSQQALALKGVSLILPVLLALMLTCFALAGVGPPLEECLKPVDLPGRGCTFPDHPEQALKQGRRANAGREGTPGAYSNP